MYYTRLATNIPDIMPPASSLGLDLVSAVAIGAAGVAASAALYALSGSGKSVASKDNGTTAPAAAKPAASPISDNEAKLTKKQRQKMNRQKKKEEATPAADTVSIPKGLEQVGTPSSDGTQSPSEDKPKKKKKSKKNKNKNKQTSADSTDEASTPPLVEEEDEEPVDDDGELAFALALAGNQKNMQQMRNEQKTRQQKEDERVLRRKAAEDREKRDLLKEEERLRLLAEAEAAEKAGLPKEETTVIAVKPREVQIILGQSGKVIKQIRQESGARLDVSKRDDEDSRVNKDRRLLTIVGTKEQILDARRLLRAVFKEENDKTQVVDVGDKMAAVIGKSGSVIKRIKEETGATLDADRESGTIRVSGEPDQIEQAVTAIKKISSPGDQISMKINKRQKMLVIGKGGEMIRSIEKMTDCQLEVEKTEDGGGMLKIGGDSTHVLEAMKTIQKLFHESSFSVTVDCGDLIGAIIGKGGEVIRKIQEETQVKMDIDMEKKCVVLVGYEKDVLKAKAKVEGILACPVEVKAGDTKLHVDLVGYVSSIIGRGGSKVREIEESSGAIVKVMGTECIIVGKQKNVENAKRQIDDILKKQMEASVRNEQAIAAVRALSESYNATTPSQTGTVPWGASAWGNDLAHWTAFPVVASR